MNKYLIKLGNVVDNVVKDYKKLAITGLAGLAIGCIEVRPTGLPSDDPHEGRQLVVYEGDIQNAPKEFLSYEIGSHFNSEPAGTIVTPLEDRDNASPPFDVGVRGRLLGNGLSKWYIDFSDNNNAYVSGEKWTIRIDPVPTGFITGAEYVTVTYLAGSSNPNIEEDIEDLTDRVEDLEDTGGPLYVVGDGICEGNLGENAQNSVDCVVDDGGTDMGPNLEKLLSQVRTEFVDNNGNKIPLDTSWNSSDFTVVTYVPLELDKTYGGVVGVGVHDVEPSTSCIDVGSFTEDPVREVDGDIVMYVVNGSVVKPETCDSPSEFIEAEADIAVPGGSVTTVGQVLIRPE